MYRQVRVTIEIGVVQVLYANPYVFIPETVVLKAPAEPICTSQDQHIIEYANCRRRSAMETRAFFNPVVSNSSIRT